MDTNNQLVAKIGDVPQQREVWRKAAVVRPAPISVPNSREERYGGYRPASMLAAVFAVLGLCALAPIPALAQQVEWVQRANSGPTPRGHHAMDYDAARGVTVLFGGLTSNGQPNGETWEWSGLSWTLRTFNGPPPRIYHAMAYDTARGVTVLFGGFNEHPLYGDTWEWDGTAWTQRSVSGPSPRIHHAMAYDATRGVTVLFGGADPRNGETWEWNGFVWTQRLVDGPSPRTSHRMTYDAARGVTVLFGGATSNGANGETWEWDGTAWTQRLVSGPSPRQAHAMTYDAARGVTVLFGGAEFGVPGPNGDETWEWDGTAWTPLAITGPSRRTYPAMAYDSARGATVLFGGRSDSGFTSETWELGVTGSATLVVTPADGLTSSGVMGGPFSPLSQLYTLTNEGGESLNWTATKTQTWVTLSASSGALAAGESTTLTVSIQTGANSLTPGSYGDLVTITNAVNGQGDTTRAVALTITSPCGGDALLPIVLVSSKSNDSVVAYQGDSGVAARTFSLSSSGVDYPNGLIVDENGDFYVASVGTDNVRKFDGRSGTPLLQFGGGGLNDPDGVLLHESTPGVPTLLVSSFSTSSVKQFSLETGLWIRDFVLPNAGVPGAVLDGPAGLAHAANGNVLVSSQRGDQVLEFDATTGEFVRIAAEDCGLDGPEGLLLIPDGNLVIASFNGGNVLRFAPDGSCGEFIPAGSGGLIGPSSLGWAPNGNLLVASRHSNNLLEFDATSGAFVRVFATGGGLSEPTHLAVAYWCDPDCNSNAMVDRWDVDADRSTDVNYNSVPDECDGCIGDISGSGDGTIGLDDLAVLLSHFGCVSPPASSCPGDLNNDHIVDLADLAIMLSLFGTTCR